jgi:hypothetical protein
LRETAALFSTFNPEVYRTVAQVFKNGTVTRWTSSADSVLFNEAHRAYHPASLPWLL